MGIKETLKLQKKKRKLDKKIGNCIYNHSRLLRLINKRTIINGLLERGT